MAKQNLFEHLWAYRNTTLSLLAIDESPAAFVLDILLILFCSTLSVFAIGVAIKSLYRVTVRVMVAITGLIVAMVGLLFVRFALKNMTPVPDSVIAAVKQL